MTLPVVDPADHSPVRLPPAAASVRRSRIIPRRAARVLATLLFASACCLSMIVLRRCYTGHWKNLFLIWNLVLAWIPLPFSVLAYRVHAGRRRRTTLFSICALTWFVFFPNAPYITTDLVNLRVKDEVLTWIDLISLASFAWVGLCLGFCSLYLMQEVVGYRFGRRGSWAFVLAMLAAASFGTYVGRFLRWNSWDVLHPFSLLADWAEHAPSPPAITGIYLGLMFLFLLLSYSALFALTHLHEQEISAA